MTEVELDQARREYDELVARGLKLDLTRGKPSPRQLDLANGMLDAVERPVSAAGLDLRN